jgi:hypothetical protein
VDATRIGSRCKTPVHTEEIQRQQNEERKEAVDGKDLWKGDYLATSGQYSQ